MKPKLAGADCREAEYAALKLETEDKDKQLNSCRLQLQAMEEEQNYSRARIAELSDLAHSKDNADKTLREKARVPGSDDEDVVEVYSVPQTEPRTCRKERSETTTRRGDCVNDDGDGSSSGEAAGDKIEI